ARAATLARPFDELREPLRRFATDYILEHFIQADLKLFNIRFDRFFSEKQLHDRNAIAAAVELLEKKGVLAREVLEAPATRRKRGGPGTPPTPGRGRPARAA